MQVVRVSGTIKKAEQEAVRRARLSIRRAQRAAGRNVVGVANGSGAEMMRVQSVEAMEESMGFEDGIEDADEPGDEDEESD